MKVKTIPQEYEAIRFRDDIEACYDVQEFLKGSGAQLKYEGGKKILSTVIGNKYLEDGDIIYKDELMCSVIKNDSLALKYFEVIEND